MPTLIAYATLRGSTKEIAERITTVLEAKGIAVTLLPVDQVKSESLTSFTSVIVGSAVIGFEWLGSATTFLKTNATQLGKVPTWAFSTGCPNTSPKRFEKAWDVDGEPALLENAAKSYVPSIKGHVLFLGKFLKGHFTLGWRLFWSAFGGKYGDFRDWDEIEAWAGKVGDEILKLEGAEIVAQ
jgi:menaquinone-dependent protoporphyrinogen oxidase